MENSLIESTETMVSDMAEKAVEEVVKLNGTVDSISTKLGDELVNFSQVKKMEQQVSNLKKELTELVIRNLLSDEILKNDYFKKSVSSSIGKIATIITRPDKEDLNGNVIPGFVRTLVADIVILKHLLDFSGNLEVKSILDEYGVKIEDNTITNLCTEDTKERVSELVDTLFDLNVELVKQKEDFKTKIFNLIPENLRATPANKKGITPQQALKLMEVKAITKINPAKSADVTSKILDDSISSSESALLFASLAGTMVDNNGEN